MNGYKYRAKIFIEEEVFRDIDLLLKDELWASSLTNLNDPFEATYDDNITDALKLFELLFETNTNEVKKQWDELISFKEKVGIYSLALSECNYPDNELMWAHYADSHKGFCIEYDVDKLEDSQEYSFDISQMKINYQNSPPVIGLDDVSRKADFLIKMFGTKSKSWVYENEIRLVYSTCGTKKYNPFALKAVYFGLNMDEEFQRQIIKGLESRDVKFYKMQRQPGAYKLMPVIICENKRLIEDRLFPSLYEILRVDHIHAVENFHVLYKGSEVKEDFLKKFITKFREEYATKQSNVNLYDSIDIIDLIGEYPLQGKNRALMAEHWIASSTFDVPDFIFMYPDK
jgi:hypothetical protein